MLVKDILEQAIMEFSNGSIDKEDYVGLSIATDGLMPPRSSLVGVCAYRPGDGEWFERTIKGGSPHMTEDKHGLTMDDFGYAVDASKALRDLTDFVGRSYCVTSNSVFYRKFVECAGRFDTSSFLDVLALWKAWAYGVVTVALSEDVSLTELTGRLDSFQYPPVFKRPLRSVTLEFIDKGVTPSWARPDYINRLIPFRRNAVYSVLCYSSILESLACEAPASQGLG